MFDLSNMGKVSKDKWLFKRLFWASVVVGGRPIAAVMVAPAHG